MNLLPSDGHEEAVVEGVLYLHVHGANSHDKLAIVIRKNCDSARLALH